MSSDIERDECSSTEVCHCFECDFLNFHQWDKCREDFFQRMEMQRMTRERERRKQEAYIKAIREREAYVTRHLNAKAKKRMGEEEDFCHTCHFVHCCCFLPWDELTSQKHLEEALQESRERRER